MLQEVLPVVLLDTKYDLLLFTKTFKKKNLSHVDEALTTSISNDTSPYMTLKFEAKMQPTVCLNFQTFFFAVCFVNIQ